jgi:hypothetical protein
MSCSAWPFVSRSHSSLSPPSSTLGPLPPITRNPTPQPGAPVGRKHSSSQCRSLVLVRAIIICCCQIFVSSLIHQPAPNCSHYTTSLPPLPLNHPPTLLQDTCLSYSRSPSADWHLPAISDSLSRFPRLPGTWETFPNNFAITKNLPPKGHPVHFAPAH